MPAIPITVPCQKTATNFRNSGLRMHTGCKAFTDPTNQTEFRGIVERDPSTDTKNNLAGHTRNIEKLKISTPLTDRIGSAPDDNNYISSNN